MDVALLLILPVLGGYYFTSNWNFTKYRCAREDGHRLYFRAALYGTFLFLIAHLLRVMLLNVSGWYVSFENSVVNLIQPLLKKPDAANLASNPSVVVVTAVYALVLGLLSWIPLNMFFKVGPSLLRAVKDDDFERLIQSAVLRRMPLSVTMDNKKVYVGFVVTTSDPAHVRKTLGILPLVSGYRDDVGRVNFTTFYSAIYKAMKRDSETELSHLSPDDFEVVLPIEKIQSANLFDFVAYEEFGRGKKNKKQQRIKTRAG
jgi:hypothetical protein